MTQSDHFQRKLDNGQRLPIPSAICCGSDDPGMTMHVLCNWRPIAAE